MSFRHRQRADEVRDELALFAAEEGGLWWRDERFIELACDTGPVRDIAHVQ